MIALHEMFFYAISNWGEKTPRSTFDVSGTKDWSVMKDSNILSRDEGIETFNSEKVRAEK
jgi:hypothetical protein